MNKYELSPAEVKEYMNKYHAEKQSTEEYRAYQRAYQREYRARKKAELLKRISIYHATN
tara:strand:- start:1896 stop:2072 length:177 start_codon:yes stop_codon:yes gene_type:complete